MKLEIADIRRWEVRPGDRLIIRADRKAGAAAAARIKGIVRGSLSLPEDFPVLLLDDGMSVEVASREAG